MWVFENVKKDFAVSIPSALEVLRVRKGDCNEHTTLFVALARSIGIPSKICVGLVYKEGYFYYHAWPEVWIGEDLEDGYWLPMDPTFGQTTSDATHIKLLEGDLEKQVEIARVVGKLEVEVLDYDNHQEFN
ncbi:MAG: transglutaminase-like domain-containing protein [Candidatus Zixiibacteriota bacterium]